MAAALTSKQAYLLRRARQGDGSVMDSHVIALGFADDMFDLTELGLFVHRRHGGPERYELTEAGYLAADATS
jgi:hypothetical protein